jgi:hypothetical protein
MHPLPNRRPFELNNSDLPMNREQRRRDGLVSPAFSSGGGEEDSTAGSKSRWVLKSAWRLPMTPRSSKLSASLTLGLFAALALLCASVVYTQAQWPIVPATTPMSQRNAYNLVINQVNWFQNATRTASSYQGSGYGMLLQQFQNVCSQYAALKVTLNPQQLNAGANQLAELDAGLNIIQEAFTDYQTEVANGQSPSSAFSNMAQVLNQAMRVWVQEFKQVCQQLRVGW